MYALHFLLFRLHLTHLFSMSVLNDAEFLLANINSTLFPGAPDAVQVHSGFSWTQGRTADAVLAAVKGAISGKKAKSVKIFGHSLGAAIAMLDALMIKAALPDVPQQTVTFGLPRGGNQAFADFTDKQVRISCGSSARL
jgi:predicted lipase